MSDINEENTPAAPEPEAPAAPEPQAEPSAEEIISGLRTELDGMRDAYLRAHAEMENTRKRAEADVETRSRFALQNFARDILSVADNLQRAREHLPRDLETLDETVKNLAVGLEMTEKGLMTVLERYGVTPVPGVGTPFDPHIHQAVQEADDPSVPAGTVVRVFQSGYRLHDRLLRAAMVVVSRGGPKGEGVAPAAPGSAVDTEA